MQPRIELVPRFTIRGNRKSKIWTAGLVRPELARHIVPQIRRLIALWEIPGISVKRYAALCGLEAGEFLHLNRSIRTEYAFTQFQAIRFCIEHGLPASAWVDFPPIPGGRSRVVVDNKMSIICPRCDTKIHGLPCIQCKKGPDDDPESLLARVCDDDPILGVPEPTMAGPGTPEKIEVLRERFMLGQFLWHDEDDNRPTASGLWELENE